MRLYINILCFISLLALSSCHYKTICHECDAEATIMIKFDWSKIDFMPEGMTVLFYNENDELVYSFLNVSPDGRLVNLNAGKYHAVCYNNDTEYIHWRNQDNINTLEAYTNPTELKASHTRVKETNEILIAMPDRLCGQCRWDIEVVPEDDVNQVILFTPQLLTDTYIYKFTNVVNSQYITSIKATLSGLNNGYFIAHPDKSPGTCTMPFDGNVDKDDQKMITGNMLNFGATKGQTNNLTLYIWSKGGNIKGTWNVTNQVVEAPNPHYVVIIIDAEIVIPIPIGNGGDVIEPSVDEWIDINETVIL